MGALLCSALKRTYGVVAAPTQNRFHAGAPVSRVWAGGRCPKNNRGGPPPASKRGRVVCWVYRSHPDGSVK